MVLRVRPRDNRSDTDIPSQPLSSLITSPSLKVKAVPLELHTVLSFRDEGQLSFRPRSPHQEEIAPRPSKITASNTAEVKHVADE